MKETIVYPGQDELLENEGEILLKKIPEFNEKVITVLSLYRLVSLLLTSTFYLFESIGPPQLIFKLGVVLLLSLAAFLSLNFYRRNTSNFRALAMLSLGETIGIAMVMAFTGGFESPFVWYALNPLIIASIHLPFFYTWFYLGLLMLLAVLEQMFIYGISFFQLVIIQYLDLIFILLLVTLTVQIFSRLYLIMIEQSHRFRLQQEELFSAYQTLSENHQMIKVLTDFQRDIVSYKKEEDIFSRLPHACETLIPFSQTAVFCLEEPVPPSSLTPKHKFKIISDHYHKGNNYFNNDNLETIKDRWQEFSPQKPMITDKERKWMAMPVWGEGDRLVAVLVGWVRQGTKLQNLPGGISLFIYFTEQVIHGLYNLKQMEHTLQHLSSLYEAVETISSRSDIKEIIDLFAAYAKAMTGCDKVVFWIEEIHIAEGDGKGEKKSIYTVKGKQSVFPEKTWREDLLRTWSDIRESLQPSVQLIEGESGAAAGQLICVPVKSRSRCLGMLSGLQFKKMYNSEEVIQTLSFLAELSAITIERNVAELFADRLLVIEEQKRIANEIHDSISQNLFSIVCGLDAITRGRDTLSPEERASMDSIRNVAAQTAKELRLLIYRLSPRHREDNTFIKDMENYLEGLGNLNQVKINFKCSGKEEYLNPAIRKAFYRIIREATGNAVRHGEGDNIKVKLDMTPFGSNLVIEDNGKGFNTDIFNDRDCAQKKLGLVNMRELAHSLGGVLTIDSREKAGTIVNCHIPTSPVSRGEAR